MVYYIETIIFLFKFVNEFCPFFIHHCASGESSSVPNFLFSSLRYSSKTMGRLQCFRFDDRIGKRIIIASRSLEKIKLT